MLVRLRTFAMMIAGALLTTTCGTFGLAELLALGSSPQNDANDARARTFWLSVRNRNSYEMAGLVRALEGGHDHVTVEAWPRLLRLTGAQSEIVRIGRIVRAVDRRAGAGERLWTVPVHAHQADDLAHALDEPFDHNRAWREGQGISKIVADDRGHRLIILGNEAGYRRLLQMRLAGS
ncbi:MAG TPA: hypothetical protein VKQ32_17730 [Polyangia bacterium]|nr:hypothetical protein [Polyangia bacterium]